MKPTFKRLIVKVDTEYTEEKQLASGLFVPASPASKMKFWQGLVLSVGNQVTTEIKVGDTVIMPPNSGMLLEDGTRLIDDSIVLGILETH